MAELNPEIMAHEPKRSLEIDDIGMEKLQAATIDERDMWRMGRVQELKVDSSDWFSQFVPNSISALSRAMGDSWICINPWLRLGICFDVSGLLNSH